MRRIWAALLLLPTLAWAQAFDSDAFDSTNSFDTNSFDFAAPTVCTVDDASPVPGTTITVSSCPAFAGAITHLTSPSGDIVNAEAGATTTSASFIIPAALTGFVSGGSFVNTEWGLDLNWVVDDGSETNLTYTMRIDPPELTGPDYWFGTVTAPVAGDSVFPAAAAAGDEFYVERVSGTSVSVNTNGSSSAASDYELNATLWDESLNGGNGAWSAVENTSFDATPPAFSSANVDATGLIFALVLDEAASQGAGWNVTHLTLSASGGAATLTYSSGNGTTTHVFATSRTIEPGETITVSWAGTTDGLEDAVGNDVEAFSAQSVTNNSSSDVTAPTVSTVTIASNGTDVTIALDENGNIGAGGSGGFSLLMSGGTTALTYASGDGTASLVFNPARTIEAGETGTLTYVQPGNGIEDDSGNDLVSFSGQAATNNSTADVTAPLFSSAAIPSAGTSISITLDGSVVFGAGGNGGFAIASCSGGAVTPTYASGSGSDTLVYNLSRTVGVGETGCTIAYTQPTNGVEDAAGNDLASFGAQSVTNNSTADITAPTRVAASITADTMQVTWSEAVTNGAGGAGGHALTCSGGAVTPTYSLGAGGATYFFGLSRSVDAAETCTYDYTQPGNGVEDLAGNDLVSFSGAPVTVRSVSDCAAAPAGSPVGSVVTPVVQSLLCVH